MNKKKLLFPVIAGVAALTLVGGVAVGVAMDTNDVTLTVDGAAEAVSTREDTVGELLAERGITLKEHDVVLPSSDSQLADGLEIVVDYARPLTLTVDGEERLVWTTGKTVAEALGALKLDAEDSKVSASRSDAIGREGLALSVITAKDVNLVVAGETKPVRVAGTVADALSAAGITLDSDDQVKPAASEQLTQGMEISVISVETKESTKEVEVPFDKKTVESADLNKGKREVTTKGVVGLKKELYKDTFHDGKLVESVLQSSEVVKEPVTEVTTVGTKVEQKKAAETKKESKSSDEGSPAGGSQDLTPATANSCKASYYWESQPTANGERFNPNALTAAHKSLKFNSKVKVTNPSNGKSVVVRINDRGPYVAGRCLDLSRAAMAAIGGTSAGVITVNWEVIG